MTRLLPSYALVTPVHDEATNLPRLVEAVVAQTAQPSEWVLVDDGSTDGTREHARSLADSHPWVRLVELPSSATATRGAPIVRSFLAGEATVDPSVEVVVKLDADVSMDPDYFERLLGEFAVDEALGIASGTALEWQDGEWRPRFGTGTSVWGAARAYRRACFTAVSPLVERMGWDSVDEHKAQLAGWRTRTLPGLSFRHHRAEGARDESQYGAWHRQGELAYYLGYRPSYLALRTVYHLRRSPAAVGLVAGYLRSLVRRGERCPDPDVRRRVRELQRLRSARSRIREKTGRSLSSG